MLNVYYMRLGQVRLQYILPVNIKKNCHYLIK
jgi:hypothetical protein